jgi:hypothetical protein
MITGEVKSCFLKTGCLAISSNVLYLVFNGVSGLNFDPAWDVFGRAAPKPVTKAEAKNLLLFVAIIVIMF